VNLAETHIVFGAVLTMHDMATMAGVSLGVMYDRVRSGMPPEIAVILPAHTVTYRIKSALAGTRFGYLTVVADLYQPRRLQCRCDCGNVVERKPSSLKRAANPSCGCMTGTIQAANRMARAKDHTGAVYNGICVIGPGQLVPNKYGNIRLWNCRCHCGNVFDTVIAPIKSGNNTSCGCGTTRHMVDGKLLTIREMATIAGISVPGMIYRLRRGLSPTQAVKSRKMRQPGLSFTPEQDGRRRNVG
jgi:hypothetical protein